MVIAKLIKSRLFRVMIMTLAEVRFASIWQRYIIRYMWDGEEARKFDCVGNSSETPSTTLPSDIILSSIPHVGWVRWF